MFERFTDGARSAVVRAQQEARELGHGYLGTEHLLLGVAVVPGGGATVLRWLGFDAGAARAELVRIVGPGSAIDDEALRDLGIDVDEVRRRVEQAFGPGALEREPVAARPRSRRWRRRCEEGTSAGRLPFTPRAKRSLQLAVREAGRLGRDQIATEHVLLGLIRSSDTIAVKLLTVQGLETPRIRAAVEKLDRGDDGGVSMVGA